MDYDKQDKQVEKFIKQIVKNRDALIDNWSTGERGGAIPKRELVYLWKQIGEWPAPLLIEQFIAAAAALEYSEITRRNLFKIWKTLRAQYFNYLIKVIKNSGLDKHVMYDPEIYKEIEKYLHPGQNS